SRPSLTSGAITQNLPGMIKRDGDCGYQTRKRICRVPGRVPLRLAQISLRSAISNGSAGSGGVLFFFVGVIVRLVVGRIVTGVVIVRLDLDVVEGDAENARADIEQLLSGTTHYSARAAARVHHQDNPVNDC